MTKSDYGRQIYLKYKDFVWILDDESYFTLAYSEINGNDNKTRVVLAEEST